MKLFYTPGACSLVVHIIIHEIGVTCEYEAVDLKTKKTKAGDDFLSINPKGAVPVLKLNNGEVLTENAVILQYLADSAHATQLLPPVNDFERYRTLEWLNLMASDFHKGLGVFFNPSLPPEVKEKVFMPIIKQKFEFVDHHLASSTYLLGDHFTLPDAYLFVMLTWAIHFKIDIRQWKNLARFFDLLKTRPSVLAALQEEGLSF